MKIRILGCHASDQLVKEGSVTRSRRACGFVLNDSLLLDAGTAGAALTFEEQRRLRHVLISHLHFDHIQGLPTLADTLIDDPGRPLALVSIPEVLKGLQSYIFNGEVYPDFMRLPSADQPVFALQPLEAEREVKLGGARVTAIPVNHQVPTVGFIIEEGDAAVVYSGDTYETEALWRAAARVPNLKAAFIEVSFPDALTELARVSAHLTPRLFAQEFKKIGRPDLPVYAYHIKPRFRETITEELGRLDIPNVRVLEEGQELVL